MNEDLQTQRLGLRKNDQSVVWYWLVPDDEYRRLCETAEAVKQMKRVMKEEGS